MTTFVDSQKLTKETTTIKVIVIKSKGQKALIGFSSNPEEFVTQWVKVRSQFTDFTKLSETHFTVKHTDYEDLRHFYATSIRDGETCWVSLNDNCMGFNDNH